MPRKSSLPYVFIVPAMSVLAIMSLLPLAFAVWLSLLNRTLNRPVANFVGLDNYIAMFSDRRFLNALWVSLKWEVVTVTGTMLVALALGILLLEATSAKWRGWLTLLFLVPVLLPRVCAAFVWKFAFHPLYGIVTYPYRIITGHPLDLLSGSNSSLLAVAFVDIWQWAPFFGVIVLKLLEALPQQPIEAARIDNAKPWEVHLYITLPMLRVPLVSLVFVKAIESLRSFDLVYVMTRGGPGIATETLDMYAFSQGFIEAGKISYASSMGVVMMLVTLVAFTIMWRRVRT
jgi:multiple sugar transport system permease protein